MKTGKGSAAIRKQIYFWALCALFLLVTVRFTRAEENNVLTVRFKSAEGTACSWAPDLKISPGGTVVLPKAQASQNAAGKKVQGVPAWKLGKNADIIAASGQKLTYTTVKKWISKYGYDTTLTFYGTKAVSLRYLSADGKKTFFTDYAYERTQVTLRTSPKPDNTRYKGWIIWNGSTRNLPKFGDKYTVIKDKNVFLLEYVKISYLDENGIKESSALVEKGSNITLPALAQKQGCRNIGWRKQGGDNASLKPGTILKATSDMTFYAVRQYTPYTVRFADEQGEMTDRAFTRLAVRCAREMLTLPEVPEKTAWVGTGWSVFPGGGAGFDVKKPGDKVNIQGDITFYAVYRPARKFSVKFCGSDGSTSAEFQKLGKTVYENQKVTLPGIPAKANCIGLGWALSINGTRKTYPAGTTLMVMGNYTFYAQYEQGCTVTLKYNSGTVIRSDVVRKGSTYTLPCIKNPSGCTFLGWDTVRNKQTDPAYEPYESISAVNGNLVLYSVIYNRSRETNLSASQLPALNTGKYSRLILVGDSRTDYMQKTLTQAGYGNNNIAYIARAGEGLSWFQSTGYPKLLSLVKTNTGSDLPTAVVFNLGVNDVKNLAHYITFFNQIAPELRKCNCRLFYMSVNPICSATRRGYVAGYTLKESDVRRFNRTLWAGIHESYQYIDMYQYLMTNGFGTSTWLTSGNAKGGVDDGLHYLRATNKKIFTELLRIVNKS